MSVLRELAKCIVVGLVAASAVIALIGGAIWLAVTFPRVAVAMILVPLLLYALAELGACVLLAMGRDKGGCDGG